MVRIFMLSLRRLAITTFDKSQYLLGAHIANWPFEQLMCFFWRRLVSSSSAESIQPTAISHAIAEIPEATKYLASNVKTLGLRDFAEMSAAAHRLLETSDLEALKKKKADGPNPYKLDLVDPAPGPDLFTAFANQPALIAIVERYLGVKARLYEKYVWLDIPLEGEATTTQLWHRDPDDFRGIKIFLHLDEVTEEKGPFTFIPAQHSKKIYGLFGRFRRYATNRRLNDEEMASYIPEEFWVKRMGPVGELVLVDTMACFHKGEKPKKKPRFLFSAAYTSVSPRVEWK